MLLHFAVGSILVILFAVPLSCNHAFAQAMRFPTSGKSSLDVAIQPMWSEGGKVQFKVDFLQKGTQLLQQDVSYDLLIFKESGNKSAAVFDAVNTGVFSVPTGFPTSLSTGNGTFVEPYDPLKLGVGNYTVKVVVYGIGGRVIEHESVEMPIQVTPEFPYPVVILVSAVIGAVIAISRTRLLPRLYGRGN